ncbi:sensor domain-containing diguanylate cyclase [Neobacillus jeddahensis]|uniref:sensor domain-containing diguanylate cyclase n=1 Tax=Neobacillus jeddahensis TaxID=1461580 RepID=UPI0005917B8F|nr:diguanylate cyclase [Neobacillus jeddahensis]
MNAIEGDLLLDVVKYKKLFQIAEKLHSSMDVDFVLGEIFVILKEVYPNYSYYLLLSLDTHSHSDLPIIDLEYDGENIMAINTYVSGQVHFETSFIDKHAVLYVPLKGKQGVYGVLQIIAPDCSEIPTNEIEFITLMSACAGGALENAQLFQQTKRTISELQLINDTSYQLNSNQPLAETLTFMSEQIKDYFEAQEVGFFLFSTDHAKSDAKALPGSTPYFFTQKSQTYINYIKEKIQEGNEPLFIGDLTLPTNQQIAAFHSIMAVPLVVEKKLTGFFIIMHESPYFFSFDTFKLLQALVHHSSLALTNSLLREELKKMVIIDHLTNLYSRKFLDEKIQQSMKEDEEGTFILVDIDNFKKINDTFGHQIGDEVLIQVADLIREIMRESDIGSRWGGEELAIYLPRTSLQSGVTIAETIVKRVSESSDPHVTVSCGVSYWSINRLDSYQYLFKRADDALYIAKETGKNMVVVQGGKFGNR